jgi:hypothetical protein
VKAHSFFLCFLFLLLAPNKLFSAPKVYFDLLPVVLVSILFSLLAAPFRSNLSFSSVLLLVVFFYIFFFISRLQLGEGSFTAADWELRRGQGSNGKLEAAQQRGREV